MYPAALVFDIQINTYILMQNGLFMHLLEYA